MILARRSHSPLSAVSWDHYQAFHNPSPAESISSREQERQDRYRKTLEPRVYPSSRLERVVTPSRPGLQTPPQEMTTNVNPMLAPTYGGLYKGTPATKSSSVNSQQTAGSYNVKTFGSNSQSATGLSSRLQSSPRRDKANSYDSTSQRQSSSNGNAIVSYLQIPATINNSKGSLAEFAAQITCLFWFESSFTLHRVEESKALPIPTMPLVPEAMPTMGFRKWVTTILSTTQVTQNVILLALMFIYRLKKLNPTVKGKPGSEFRLLTVALMLGNKFLDDNTYTNKTWAEVSGISVQEIHIMEVEFLSNMRYTLYASELEWRLWHAKLGKFWNYFDHASKTLADSPKSSGVQTPMLNIPPTLPSPPASLSTSPLFLNNHSPVTSGYPRPFSIPPYLAPAIPSPIAPMPEVDLRPSMRKRSYDDQSRDPPAKRIAQSLDRTPTSLTTMTPSSQNYATPRLPVPNLSISTGGGYQGSYTTYLPPPAGRLVTSSYSGVGQRAQNGHAPPSQQHLNSSSLPPMIDHSRSQGPYSAGSRTSSPTSNKFPQGSSQDLLSPSGFPVQRNSPYKPVRSVNTLLVPPPSASMHNPSQHLGFNQMHYQTLGKPMNERKTGVVPYMYHDAWPHSHSNSQWSSLPGPSLPQPNLPQC